jgi:hypothetical protein
MVNVKIIVGLAVLTCWTALGEAKASFVSLPTTADQLIIPGAYTQVAGLRLDSFSFTDQSPVPLSAIHIGEFDNASGAGLVFTLSTNLDASGSGGFDEISFQYNATPLSSDQMINGTTITLAGVVQNDSTVNYGIDIFQTINPLNLNLLGSNNTYLDGLYGNSLIDGGTFTSQPQIQISADIQVASYADDGYARVDQVTQTIALSSVSAVPEPVSMIPLGTGLFAFGSYTFYRRRKCP